MFRLGILDVHVLKVSVLQSTFDCLISTLTRKSSYTVPHLKINID